MYECSSQGSSVLILEKTSYTRLGPRNDLARITDFRGPQGMNRNWITEGIILKTFPIGDQHRGVVLCTPENGNISVIAHGAGSPRSKLRAITLPLATGTFYLYEDPGRNSIKITDLELRKVPEGLRSDLNGFYAASLAAEVLLYGHGVSENPEFYRLFSEVLDTLDDFVQNPPSDISTDEKVRSVTTIMISFLWKYLEFSGIYPDTGICSRTEEPLAPRTAGWYNPREGGFISAGAGGVTNGEEGLVRIPAPGITILDWFLDKPFARIQSEPLPPAPLGALPHLGVFLVEQSIDRKLKSAQVFRSL